MTMIGHGADADELERLAAELGRAAHVLDSRRAVLNTHVHHAPWAGHEADRFRQSWTQQYARAMASAAAYLHAAQSVLATNAHEQRVASAAAGGAIGHSAAFHLGSGRNTELDALAVIAAGLAGQLRDLRGRSAAEQLAWWNSLSAEQRRALLLTRAGELTALSGLPPDVLQQARDNYLTSIADQVKVGSTSVQAELYATVKVVKVGGEFDVEETSFRDGHVEIDLKAALKGGVSGEVAEALASRGLSGVYSFANQKEADAFVAAMSRELTHPSAKEWALYGTGAPLASLTGFLVSQRGHLASVSVSGGASFSAEEKSVGASGKVGGESEVTATLDTQGEGKGDITLKASTSVSGAASVGHVGGTGKVELSAAMTVHGAQPTQLTFTQSYEGAALTGIFTPVAELAGGTLSSGTMEVTFDLTDPDVRSAADRAAAAMERGDVAGAASAMNGVLDRARIVVQQETGTTATASFDAKVVSGSVTADTRAVTSTYIKPPGGTFYEVR